MVRSVRDNEDGNIEYNGYPVPINCGQLTSNCTKCVIDGDEAKCTECEKGFVLVGGTCKACNAHIVNGQCSECTLTGCSSCNDDSLVPSNDGTCVSCGEDETFDLNSKTCVKCKTLYHQCDKCDASGCLACNESILHEGMCKTCKAIHGNGCTSCDNATCTTCTDDACCKNGTKIVSGSVCGTCIVYGEQCVNCTDTKCSACTDDYVVNLNTGKCASCGELYEGCGKCTSDFCFECENSSWTLTDYGCLDTKDYVTSKADSEPLNPKASSEPETFWTIGVIIGVAVGCAVVVAVVIIIVVVIVKKSGSSKKKSNNDGSDAVDMDFV